MYPGRGWPASLRSSWSSWSQIYPLWSRSSKKIKEQQLGTRIFRTNGAFLSLLFSHHLPMMMTTVTFTHQFYQRSPSSPPSPLLLFFQSWFWDWPEVVSQRKVGLRRGKRAQSHEKVEMLTTLRLTSTTSPASLPLEKWPFLLAKLIKVIRTSDISTGSTLIPTPRCSYLPPAVVSNFSSFPSPSRSLSHHFLFHCIAMSPCRQGWDYCTLWIILHTFWQILKNQPFLPSCIFLLLQQIANNFLG